MVWGCSSRSHLLWGLVLFFLLVCLDFHDHSQPHRVASCHSPLTQPAGIFKNQHKETQSQASQLYLLSAPHFLWHKVPPSEVVGLYEHHPLPLSLHQLHNKSWHVQHNLAWNLSFDFYPRNYVFLNIGRQFYYLSLDDTCVYFLSIQMTGNLDDNVFFWLFYFT